MEFEFYNSKSQSNNDKVIEAEEFDAKFDQGEDVTEYLDFSQAKRSGHQQKGSTLISQPGWLKL